MNVLSFVFLPEPSLCGGQEFKELRSFQVTYGNINEMFTVVAINCYSKSQIVSKIDELSSKYLSMSPTESNVNAATIMTWCSRVLAKGPHDHVPAHALVDIINNRCGYQTDVSDMLYVPSQGGVWSLFKADIRSRMR